MKASKLIDLTKLKFYELDQDPLINLFESNGYNVIKWSVFNVQYIHSESFVFGASPDASFWHIYTWVRYVHAEMYNHGKSNRLKLIIIIITKKS